MLAKDSDRRSSSLAKLSLVTLGPKIPITPLVLNLEEGLSHSFYLLQVHCYWSPLMHRLASVMCARLG
jgi:hypothetical protein